MAIVLLINLVPASALREPVEEFVTVTIVGEVRPNMSGTLPKAADISPEFAFRAERAEIPEPVPDQPARPVQPASSGGMIEPVNMLSAGVLSTPEAEQARRALPTLEDFDRRLQLCGLEAMEQIQAWQGRYRPDRLVAYAMQEASLRGNRVIADGAAFRSNGWWYNLQFECEVTHDIAKVISFRFAVGEPVPYEEWTDHNLPPEY